MLRRRSISPSASSCCSSGRELLRLIAIRRWRVTRRRWRRIALLRRRIARLRRIRRRRLSRLRRGDAREHAQDDDRSCDPSHCPDDTPARCVRCGNVPARRADADGGDGDPPVVPDDAAAEDPRARGRHRDAVRPDEAAREDVRLRRDARRRGQEADRQLRAPEASRRPRNLEKSSAPSAGDADDDARRRQGAVARLAGLRHGLRRLDRPRRRRDPVAKGTADQIERWGLPLASRCTRSARGA